MAPKQWPKIDIIKRQLDVRLGDLDSPEHHACIVAFERTVEECGSNGES